MGRLRLLDLFCGEGGAGYGYRLAGFDVTGVDHDPTRIRHYPCRRVVADAVEYVRLHGGSFDAIHASPPCQAYSVATKGTPGAVHPDLVAAVRRELRRSGVPWVIENVHGAPLRDPVMLCGASFGCIAQDPVTGDELFLRRHRYFETNWPATALPCDCKALRGKGIRVGGVYGGGACKRRQTKQRDRGGYTPRVATRRALMGADWMTQTGLSQAVPPAYTHHIGRQLAERIHARRRHEQP